MNFKRFSALFLAVLFAFQGLMLNVISLDDENDNDNQGDNVFISPSQMEIISLFETAGENVAEITGSPHEAFTQLEVMTTRAVNKDGKSAFALLFNFVLDCEINGFLANNYEVQPRPELKFTFTLDGENMNLLGIGKSDGVIDLLNPLTGEIRDESKIIGYYTMSQSAAGEDIVVEVIMDEKIYDYTYAYGNFYLWLDTTDENAQVGEIPYIILSEDNISGSISWPSAEDPVNGSLKYAIDKTAPKNVYSPFFDYVIKADVSGLDAGGAKVYLNDRYIKDTLPAGLEAYELEAVCYDENYNTYKIEDILGGSTATDISFKIPALYNEELKNIISVELTVKTRLNSTLYNSMMNSPSFNRIFLNTAYLYDSNNTDNLSQSEEKITDVKIVFLKKGGERDGINGGIYKWTLDGQTYLNADITSDVYVIDKIPNTQNHSYLSANILLNGTLLTVNDKREDLSVSYNNSIVPVIGLINHIKEIAGTDKVIMVKDSDANQYLIIRLDAYEVSQSFSIVYNTAMSEGQFNTNLANEARIIWRNIYYGGGHGTGISVDDGGSAYINKNIAANTELISKSEGYYDAATHNLDWKININDAAKPSERQYIKEDFDNSVMQLVTVQGKTLARLLAHESITLSTLALNRAAYNKTL